MVIAVGSVAVVLAALAWLRGSMLIATVSGHSMQPSYRPGEHVLALRRPRRIRVGEVVLLTAPDGGALVMKRVAATAGEPVPPAEPPVVPRAAEVPAGHLVVLGDHPAASTDSRQWGFVPVDLVRARVVARLPWFAPGPASE